MLLDRLVRELIADEIRTLASVLSRAGIPHTYRVIGNEAFEFLCVIPNLTDTMEILPSP
jgi:quercetin dioxygenase-like cupin family protein